MVFGSPFGKVISPVLGGGAEAYWWLSGGIAAANCKIAYQPIGAADLASSYVNLANPGTYNAAPGVAPTFGALTGWTFNGTTQYLFVGTLAANQTQAWSYLVRFAGAASVGVALGGRQALSYLTEIRPFYYGLVGYRNGNDGGTMRQVAPALTSGVVGIAGNQGYRNGVADGAAIQAGGAPGANFYLRVGAGGNSTTGAEAYFAGDILAVAVYDTILTPAQMLAVSTAMAAL